VIESGDEKNQLCGFIPRIVRAMTKIDARAPQLERALFDTLADRACLCAGNARLRPKTARLA